MTETPPATWSAMLASWRARRDPAVITDTTTWTGEEFLARAAGAAVRLEQITARPGAIPVLFTSTAAAFAWVVGGSSCGRPLAPLAPRLTERELFPCVDALGADAILTEPEFLPLATTLAARAGARVVVVDEPDAGDAARLDLDPAADAVAFVLHTSGTSGTPRAVPYTQQRLAARTRVNAALCSLDADATYATASPFHHIAGFGNYAVALASGAAVVPLPRFTVEAWNDLASLGVTHALTVPTMLELLLDAGVLALPHLRVLQYGASPIHPDTLSRTLAAIPDVEVVNIFGQTEGSPVTCLTASDHRRIAREGRRDLLASVGRAAPGVEVWIDEPDEHGAGEIHARAEHFFLPSADGVLRTGDVGRMDDERYVFLVGRRGDRIIRGGENVYPLEVEHVLEQHPGVREAAVVGVPDRRWGERIKAFVVATGGGPTPSADELRTFARAQLAGFKVPAEWEFVAALPRNPAGKLVRRDLVGKA